MSARSCVSDDVFPWKGFISLSFFFFFLVSRDAESQRVSSISCFLNFVIDFAFFCVW